MSEAYEMYESIEDTIKDLIQEYQNLEAYTDCEEYRRQGAISALERLLYVFNE